MNLSETEQRILIYTPRIRDAELTEQILRKGGLGTVICADMIDVGLKLREGAGAILIAGESLDDLGVSNLISALASQEAWSEMPLLIFAPSGDQAARTYERINARAHLTLLDRPIHVKSLLSVVHSALRSRIRQYEIRELMKRLEERVDERDRFLAILGHELRNPLGAILLASQMVDPEERKLDGAHAAVIERQSRHLTRLVNDLLDLSRVASGKIILKQQVIDLVAVVRQSMQVIRDTAMSHKLEMNLNAPAEPVLIQADPVRIDQILGNLLTNSIKYTPEGGHVTVSIETNSDRAAIIRVKDDGVGVSPDRIGRIFELFNQAENAIGRSQGGMGIGLALVRNLVSLHGGTVSASSDGVGKGSEFVVALPLAKEQTVSSPVQARKSGATSAPRKIVIVEDNADVRDLLRLKLRKLGHEVHAAADGLEGVKAVIEIRPDLALVDIGLPGIDGYEVAARVRQQVGHDVFLVAVSGFGLPEDKRRAQEAGFDEHLTKPADVNDIENVLARFQRRPVL